MADHLLPLKSDRGLEQVLDDRRQPPVKNGPGDFAGVALGELGRRAGCSVTFTFDRKAARLPGFTLA